jgi:hypothetical protein
LVGARPLQGHCGVCFGGFSQTIVNGSNRDKQSSMEKAAQTSQFANTESTVPKMRNMSGVKRLTA